ncbi:solute carrier organic anion transporter family member 6A1-like [Psammomys obesus]|uniref:solute carrier organic anion transporter family member 6A1-like n=1 Tax=Psammomys obesus TaxID=48139 RepID=UPI002452ABBE|nr:solute carrier organic anion transporter family member 6A1-like [Psammomys obesus]
MTEEDPGQIQDRPDKVPVKDESEKRSVGSKKTNPFLTVTLMRFSYFRRAKNFFETDVFPSPKQVPLVEGPFGLGSLVFTPFQRFNNIKCFVTLYCLLVLVQGMVFGLTDLSIGNFEKELYLSRPERYVLPLTYDISSLSVAILVAYCGSRGNRARWVAVSAFLVGLGSLLLAIPYMKYEIVKPMEDVDELCSEEEHRTVTVCEENVSPYKSQIISLFIAGQSFQGFAGMPIYILGLTFIYDHVSTHSAGLYLGLGEAVQILGYGVGYTVGAPNLKPSHNHTEEDWSNHQYKWWQINWLVGFLGATLLAWFLFFPLLCFPTNLPGAQKIRLRKERKPSTVDRRLKDKEMELHVIGLWQALKSLIKSPLMMCYAMCKATESLANIGSAEFLPKYLENQFLLTPSLATLLTGIILIPGGAIGIFLGGFVVSKLKLSCRSQMRFIMATSIISLGLLVLVIFVKCETVDFAGINEDYDGLGNFGNLTAPCNELCDCKSSVYSSVCGRDETEYFSPCFAGCIASKILHNEKTYYNCSCIKEGLTNADSQGDFIDAVPGKCNTKCFTLPLFFAFFFCAIAFSNSGNIPITLMILR